MTDEVKGLHVVIRDRTRTGARSAARNITTMSGAAKAADASIGKLETGLGGVGTKAQATVAPVQTLTRSMRGLSVAAAAYIGLRTARSFADQADTATNLADQLKLVTRNSEELADVQGRLFVLAKDTKAPLEATSRLYSRVARSVEQLGLSQNELIGFTRTVNQTLRLSGAGAQEGTAGLIQFSQALASNRFQGDELRSVLENLPFLATTIAKGLGVTRGELRELGADGELTAERIVRAIQRQSEIVNDQFQGVSNTFGTGLTNVENSFINLVSKVDAAFDATGQFTRAANAAAGALDRLAKDRDEDGKSDFFQKLGEPVFKQDRPARPKVGLFDFSTNTTDLPNLTKDFDKSQKFPSLFDLLEELGDLLVIGPRTKAVFRPLESFNDSGLFQNAIKGAFGPSLLDLGETPPNSPAVPGPTPGVDPHINAPSGSGIQSLQALSNEAASAIETADFGKPIADAGQNFVGFVEEAGLKFAEKAGLSGISSLAQVDIVDGLLKGANTQAAQAALSLSQAANPTVAGPRSAADANGLQFASVIDANALDFSELDKKFNTELNAAFEQIDIDARAADLRTFSDSIDTKNFSVATDLAKKRAQIRISEITDEKELQQALLANSQLEERIRVEKLGANAAQLKELDALQAQERTLLGTRQAAADATTSLDKLATGLDLTTRVIGGLNPVVDDFIGTLSRAVASGDPLTAAAEGLGFVIRRATGFKDTNERLIDSFRRAEAAANRAADGIDRIGRSIDDSTLRTLEEQAELVRLLNVTGHDRVRNIARDKPSFSDIQTVETRLGEQGFGGDVRDFVEDLQGAFPEVDLTNRDAIRGLGALSDELKFAVKNFGDINTATFTGALEEFRFQQGIQDPQSQGQLATILADSFSQVATFDFDRLAFTLKDGVEISGRQERTLEQTLAQVIRFRESSEDFYSQALGRENRLAFDLAEIQIRAQAQEQLTPDGRANRKIFADLTKQIKALSASERVFTAAGVSFLGGGTDATGGSVAKAPGVTGNTGETTVDPQAVISVGESVVLSIEDLLTLPTSADVSAFFGQLLTVLDDGLVDVLAQNINQIRSQVIPFIASDLLTLPTSGAFSDFYQTELAQNLQAGRINGLLPVLVQNRENIKGDQANRVQYKANDFITLPSSDVFTAFYRDELSTRLATGRTSGLLPTLAQNQENIRGDQLNRIGYQAADFITLPLAEAFTAFYRTELATRLQTGRTSGLLPVLSQNQENIRGDQANRIQYRPADFLTLPAADTFTGFYRTELATRLQIGRTAGVLPVLVQNQENIRGDQANRISFQAKDFITLPAADGFTALYRADLAIRLQGGRISGLLPVLSQNQENIRGDQSNRIQYTANDFITLPAGEKFKDLYRTQLALSLQTGRTGGLLSTLSQNQENIRGDQANRIKYGATDFITLPAAQVFVDLYRTQLATSLATGRTDGLLPTLEQHRLNVQEDQQKRVLYDGTEYLSIPPASVFKALYRTTLAQNLSAARTDGLLPALLQNRDNIRRDQAAQVAFSADDLISLPNATDLIFKLSDTISGFNAAISQIEPQSFDLSSVFSITHTAEKISVRFSDVVDTESEAVRIAQGRASAPYSLSPSELFSFGGKKHSVSIPTVIDPNSEAVQVSQGRATAPYSLSTTELFRFSGGHRFSLRLHDVVDTNSEAVRIAQGRATAPFTFSPRDLFRFSGSRIRIDIGDVFDFGSSLSRLIRNEVRSQQSLANSTSLQNRGA